MDETTLKDDVRQQTGYTDEAILSTEALDTAYRNAKRHIRVRKALPSTFNWFDADVPARQEALYWWTCLFAKVQTGDLDAQDVQAGAVDISQLLAKDDNEVTQWYRSARDAMRGLSPEQTFAMTNPTRSDREYGGDSDDGGDLTSDI